MGEGGWCGKGTGGYRARAPERASRGCGCEACERLRFAGAWFGEPLAGGGARGDSAGCGQWAKVVSVVSSPESGMEADVIATRLTTDASS